MRLRVALNPSVKKRAKLGAIRGSFRGFTNVSPKTAKFLKTLGLEGQLKYSNSGYVTVTSKRLPRNVISATGKSRGNTVSLHRLAYYLETGKKIPSAGRNIATSMVVDHKNSKRDDNRRSNLQLITGAENTKRISSTTWKTARRAADRTVRLKTGGTYKSAGAQGAATRKILYGEAGERKFRQQGAQTAKKKYGADYHKAIGAKGLATISKKYSKAELSARNKASYAKRSKASISKTVSAAKKAMAAILKKDPNFYKRRAAKIAAIRKKKGNYGKKRR